MSLLLWTTCKSRPVCYLYYFLSTRQLIIINLWHNMYMYILCHKLYVCMYLLAIKPSYFSCALVGSSDSGRSNSVNWLFWLLTQMCTQGHFGLVFTVILNILNNTRPCFYHQSKTDDSFWPVNVLLTCTRKVWQCLIFKCTRYTLACINILTDFDPCSHRRVKCTRYTLACISTFWLILTLAVTGGLSALDIA